MVAEHRRYQRGREGAASRTDAHRNLRDQRRAERDGSAADGEQQDQQCTGHRHHAGEERASATASAPMASDQIAARTLLVVGLRGRLCWSARVGVARQVEDLVQQHQAVRRRGRTGPLAVASREQRGQRIGRAPGRKDV